jgi:hypothetical protein
VGGALIGKALGAEAGAILEETTTLYRAVSPAEYEQLISTNTFQAGPNSLGGKFFAETAEHAAEWGTQLESSGNFQVIQVEFPKDVADSLMRWEKLDGIGPARYGELNVINAAKPLIKPLP